MSKAQTSEEAACSLVQGRLLSQCVREISTYKYKILWRCAVVML